MAGRGGPARTNGTAASNKICQFKLVLLGESAVGKSSLVLRFVKGQFHEYQESTIGGESFFFHFQCVLCSLSYMNVSIATYVLRQFKTLSTFKLHNKNLVILFVKVLSLNPKSSMVLHRSPIFYLCCTLSKIFQWERKSRKTCLCLYIGTIYLQVLMGFVLGAYAEN